MKKKIKVSVKDLVSFSTNKGHIEKKGSFTMMDAAYEGTAIHSIFQKEMIKKHGKEKFIKEKYLSLSVENDEVQLEISGRIDGLLIEEKNTIYEVKTTLKNVDDID